MRSLARWFVPALVTGWLLSAGPASAQRPRRDPDVPRTVVDDAGLFSAAAKDKANAAIADIKRRYRKDLLIETLKSAPGAKGADLSSAAERRQFFQSLAAERARNALVNGIYVLICENPKYVEVVSGQETRKEGLFTSQDDRTLANKIIARLTAREPDGALRDATAYVSETLSRTASAREPAAGPGQQHRRETSGFPPWLGWVCLGLVALVVIWVIFGAIRGLAGGGRGGYGPGYGGPGYAGGYGGGGGFFSSLLGGMFGAAAGMWMYSHFFGGGTPTAGAGEIGGAGGLGTGASDVGGDYAGAGGDYGDNAGNDAGGAGGDWGGGGDDGGGAGGDWGDGGGGGGDLGGGGDWGGGGGDFGGGGGGDW